METQRIGGKFADKTTHPTINYLIARKSVDGHANNALSVR